MRGSLFRRFTLTSVLIAFTAVIPLAVFGLYAIQAASDHLMRRTLEGLKQSILIDADRMKHLFDLAHGDLTMLTQLTIRKLARARAAPAPAYLHPERPRRVRACRRPEGRNDANAVRGVGRNLSRERRDSEGAGSGPKRVGRVERHPLLANALLGISADAA